MQLTIFRILICLIILSNIPAAVAHPLGNFSLNHYSQIKVYPQGILAQHVLDFAEIPSFNELANVDKDNNNIISPDEKDAYLESLKDSFLPGFQYTVQVDGQLISVAPELFESDILLSHGQAGMTCILVQMTAKIPLSNLTTGQRVSVSFLDDNLKHIRGFREVRVLAQDGVEVHADSVTNENKYKVVNPVDGVFGMEGLSAQFAYTVNTIQPFSQAKASSIDTFIDPASIPPIPIKAEADGSYSIVKSPLQPNQEVQSKISMLQPKTNVSVSDVLEETDADAEEPEDVDDAESGESERIEFEHSGLTNNQKGDDEWSKLIMTDDLSPWFVITAIIASIMYGMAHALSPGHGKTVVAAYLIGSRGTVLHAIFLGIIVTLTHVSSVILLGLVVLYCQQFIQGEVLITSVEIVAGSMIVWIGSTMFFRRYNAYLRQKFQEELAVAGVPQSHAHDGHHHTHDHSHDHSHDHHHHDHGHGHSHDHDDHSHSHDHDHAHGHTHDHGHSHDHEHGHHHHHHSWFDDDHEHGEHTHTHEIPADATWWDLLVLGITGGIVPCPAAVLVLLVAISTHKLVFGMVLILFFSLGLAFVLITIGVLMVVAKNLFDRIPDQGKFSLILQLVSPALVTGLGFVVIIRALANADWM